MNPSRSPSLRPSESLVGSLCLEVDGVRRRAGQLIEGMARCHDGPLLERLRRELGNLQRRHRELQRSARSLSATARRDSLGVALLLELTSRPLAG
ncbi:hypothetical protein NZK32_09250 [Cyanobium sp. FGCU-52]|nr:hypothetical protein [Cyanobium sp. FGCU52]